MKRWLSILAAVTSLVLFAAVVVLWVRSYRTVDSFAWVSHRGNSRQVGSFAGSLFVEEWQRITEGSDILDLFGWNGRRGSAPTPFTTGSRWSDRYSPGAMYSTVLGIGVISDGSLVPTIEKAERKGDTLSLSGVMKPVQRNQMTLVIPHWLLAIATAVLPCRLAMSRWRSHRSAAAWRKVFAADAATICGRRREDARNAAPARTALRPLNNQPLEWTGPAERSS